MPRFHALADHLRAKGLRVAEVDGWRTRGSADFDPRVVVAHHTAGAATGNMPSLNVLIHGRADLPGPLCQVGLGRDGTCYIVAAGRANHAGAGSWLGHSGNRSAFGIEAENTGRGEPWPAVQLDAYDRLAAALLELTGNDERYLCAHREWAPGRKIDPTGLEMDAMRRVVGAHLRGGGPTPPTPAPVPTPAPTPTPTPAPDTFKERVMALPVLRRGATGQYVRNMQGLLVANGEPVKVDGDFGPGTERGLRAWQARAKLGADGICGPRTWSALVGV